MMAKIEHWATVDDSELVGPKLEGAVAVNSLGVPMMVLCVIDQLLTVDEGLAARLKVTSDWAIQRIRSHVQVIDLSTLCRIYCFHNVIVTSIHRFID